MKVLLGYPPTSNKKGTPLLSQNRQFQYFNNPTYIFPIIPAYAATLLKNNNYKVIWKDAIAENINKKEFFDYLKRESPDLFMFETKTPVIQEHWKIINEIKEIFPNIKIAISGDHVTALPSESLKNSKVDYVITGGDFDFSLLELCNHLTKKAKLPKGIYYKEKNKIKNTGKFELKYNLDSLPLIDRKLTRWYQYQKEYNIKVRPFMYIMSGRDCWYGKCKFCFPPNTEVITNKRILKILELNHNTQILTHKGSFKEKEHFFEREYEGNLIKHDLYNLPKSLKCTPNHEIFALKKGSKKPNFIAARDIRKGDYLVFKRFTETKDMKFLNVEKIIIDNFKEKCSNHKLIDKLKITKAKKLYSKGISIIKIAEKLNIQRNTLTDYLRNTNKNIGKIVPVVEQNTIKYKGANTSIPKKIPLNKDFLKLVGFYLAEGNIFESKTRPNSAILQFTFSEKESEYIEEVCRIQRNLFNLKPVKQKNPTNHTVQIVTHSNILAHLFKFLFGSSCSNKDIPMDFLRLPLTKQEAIIEGLFKGNGCLRKKYQRKEYEYILQIVAKQVSYKSWIILTRLGILPSFYIIPKEKVKKAKRDKYALSLCSSELSKLSFINKKFKINSNVKRPSFIKGEYIHIKVKNTSKEYYSGKVYNLAVEKDQSYSANLVNVHNCAWPVIFPKFRLRSVKKVVDEIDYLIEEYKIKEIFDDTGTFPTGIWLKNFCNEIIKRGYNKKITISCNMRFNALTLEDYKLMKKANFRLLKFGLESANQKTLDKLNKNIKVKDIISGCKLAKKAKLTVHLTMIIGHPWETKEEALRTFKLAKKLMTSGLADVLQSTVIIPYPGTPLWKEAKKNKWFRFNHKDYQRYDMSEPVLKTVDMSPKEVMEICNKIYTIFISPKYILQHLKRINSLEDIKYTINGVKAIFGHMKDFSRK